VHLTWTVEDELFRDEARTWLEENVPTERRPEDEGPASRQFDVAWQRTLFAGGWAGISWPREYGGRGLSLNQEVIWSEECSRAGAPELGCLSTGIMHAGPTLIAHGRPDQQAFHLPRILRGDSTWCQGFSEPDAGSDLASLRCKAEIDGDHLVVTGHKIWTSFGHLADYQELLVRTDPAGPKHKGISWVICDMRTPGIEVRQIETLHGSKHFCEVFYDQVRIPMGNVVGSLNDGWRITITTLSFERGTSMLSEQLEFARRIDQLIAYAEEIGMSQPDGSGEFSRRLGTLRAEAAALRSMLYRLISQVGRDGRAGPEVSMTRLYYSELVQRAYRLARQIAGSRGLEIDRHGWDGQWSWGYLNSLRFTITAGTKDIQRNIIGERVLGLPRG
jgi:alkylation response protein AidB-like acyl-CoA dehydrogenase